MAQSVERRLGKAEVTGSIPVSSFIFLLFFMIIQFFHIDLKESSTAKCCIPSIKKAPLDFGLVNF